MKRFHIDEKDNGWVVTVECGSFYRELVFQNTGKCLKSLAEFMRAPVVEPEEEKILDLPDTRVDLTPRIHIGDGMQDLNEVP